MNLLIASTTFRKLKSKMYLLLFLQELIYSYSESENESQSGVIMKLIRGFMGSKFFAMIKLLSTSSPKYDYIQYKT